jgi:ATP-dependent RNA helicase CshB
MDGICYSLYDNENEDYLQSLERRGITFDYLTLKNKELVPYKSRNSREERVKPTTDAERLANSLVKKPTKVTPGYKKKMLEAKKQIVKSMKGKGHHR